MKIFHVLKFEPVAKKLIVRRIGKFSKMEEIFLSGIIDIHVMPGRYCVGKIQPKKFSYCFNKVNYGYQCYMCFRSNAFNLCAKCTGEKCLLNRKICGPHVVYLTTFANTIKVGVTSAQRFPERIIEQGADFATIIARTDDGLEARRIERTIKENFGITDRLSEAFKQGSLDTKPVELGKQLIKTAYWEVVDSLPKGTKQDLDVAEFAENYFVPEKPIPLKIEDNLNISGKIAGYRGNFIMLRQTSKLFSINGYELVGRVIKTG